MRTLSLAAIAVWGAALAGIGSAAAAPNSGAVYAVTYFEAAAPDIGKVAADLRQFAAASRNEAGNVSFDAFEQIDRPSRFAIFESWQNKASADAQNAAAATVAFRDKVQPLLVGPFEVRNLTGFSGTGAHAEGGRDAVYVLTFVDVFPPGKDQAAALLRQFAEANRKLPGNLLFDVLLRVPGIGNHFTVVEGWRDRHAFDASLMAASTREFRQKLTPLEGALYDERLYHALW
ncbi:MAG: antibiotic biosynthesis monooxygenase [Alphaproteobacteria bacterium]|nr:antibiotic biosynthesis monooxygenase [Alphaproteobacteria bacterium]